MRGIPLGDMDRGFLHSTKVFVEMEGKYLEWLEELESMKRSEGEGKRRPGKARGDVEKCIALMRWHLVTPPLSLPPPVSRHLPSPYSFSPLSFQPFFRALTPPPELHPQLHKPHLRRNTPPRPPPPIHPLPTPPLIHSAALSARPAEGDPAEVTPRGT